MGNNPISFTDPSGGAISGGLAAGIGALVGGAIGYAITEDWRGALIGAAAGAGAGFGIQRASTYDFTGIGRVGKGSGKIGSKASGGTNDLLKGARAAAESVMRGAVEATKRSIKIDNEVKGSRKSPLKPPPGGIRSGEIVMEDRSEFDPRFPFEVEGLSKGGWMLEWQQSQIESGEDVLYTLAKEILHGNANRLIIESVNTTFPQNPTIDVNYQPPFTGSSYELTDRFLHYRVNEIVRILKSLGLKRYQILNLADFNYNQNNSKVRIRIHGR